MNKIKICNKCKTTNVSYLVDNINKLNKDTNIIKGCHNMCGIGRKKVVCIVNNIPIITDTNEEMLEKIKDSLK